MKAIFLGEQMVAVGNNEFLHAIKDLMPMIELKEVTSVGMGTISKDTTISYISAYNNGKLVGQMPYKGFDNNGNEMSYKDMVDYLKKDYQA